VTCCCSRLRLVQLLKHINETVNNNVPTQHISAKSVNPRLSCCDSTTSNLDAVRHLGFHRKLILHTTIVVINTFKTVGSPHTWWQSINNPANSTFHPSGVGKWRPASAGKEKAGMINSVSGWTRLVQVNCEIPWQRVPYLSALEVYSRQGAIQIHVYLYLPLPLNLFISPLSTSDAPMHHNTKNND